MDEPVVADVDMLIDRPDLGPNCATLVPAGHVIPPELVGLPRRPRNQPAPVKSPRPRKRGTR
jgi:hypothetical protein